MITYDHFKSVELKVVTIAGAEPVAGSEKLLKLMVDEGIKNEAGEPVLRQILSGIAKYYQPETLLGRQIVIVANLEPRALMGFESNGMILAAHGENGEAIILSPDTAVPPGSSIS